MPAELARALAPSRVGWGPQPHTALREVRHRVRRRRGARLRLCLLELPHDRPPIGSAHAFWLNERSRVFDVVRNGAPERADVVWLFSQDPLGPRVRERLAARLAQLPAGVPVLNPPATYDAYHDLDAFARLEATGVSVPRTRFGPDDEGRTAVVFKALDEQPATKFVQPWRGPLPGFRPFALEDGRDADGLSWRYRAYYVAGEVLSGDAVASRGWEARAEHQVAVDLAPDLPAHEREQIALLASTLGLDAFAVDYLRRRSDGAPVFVDVNVFPSVLIAGAVSRAHGLRGGVHVWEVADRLGRPDPGRPHWRRVDEALLRARDAAVAAAAGRAHAHRASG